MMIVPILALQIAFLSVGTPTHFIRPASNSSMGVFTKMRLTHAAPMPRIYAKGEHLESNGKPIVLKTINIGGWLVNEMWMTPWITQPPIGSNAPKIVDDNSLWLEMQSRFGINGMTKVRNAWRNDWITDLDIAKIADSGIEGLRVPFRDELLHEPSGIKRLDWIVHEATKHRIYVILDMHGAPGGQSTDQPTGHLGRNHLWTSQKDQKKMLDDWAMLANRYKNDPTVAMFDLINEPMGAKNSSELYSFYDLLIKRVRQVDKKTVLLVEDGYKGFQNAPSPASMGWKNVCFSIHFYNFDAKSSQDHLNAVHGDIARAKAVMDKNDWPIYIGEFNLDPFSTPALVREYVGDLNRAGFSWGYWTWKVNGPTWLGDWGIVRPMSDPSKDANRPNPFLDSVSQLVEKLKAYRTSNMDIDQNVLNELGK